ncbi:MAG: hypothetical protein JSV99_10860 [Planctomycetota bacterium]|nr:MAG: hypothetical protein JSV99_10860 [Planctomycetota bacterium]
MTENKEHDWENITLKSLEAKLRSLSELQVPPSLRGKLLASIPERQARVAPAHPVQWRLGAWGFGAAAVVVLILALMFLPNYGPSVPSKTLIMDLNDKTIDLNDKPADLNEGFTHYIMTDQNSARAIDVGLRRLRWPTVKSK